MSDGNWDAFFDSAAAIALPASLLAFMALSVFAPMIRAFILGFDGLRDGAI
jgi:ABC-type dipeptide/oligopeptide/nickel transport system permease component